MDIEHTMDTCSETNICDFPYPHDQLRPTRLKLQPELCQRRLNKFTPQSLDELNHPSLNHTNWTKKHVIKTKIMRDIITNS